MTNRLKKIYIVALAAILSICAGFALLLARPTSASAETAVKMTIYYGNTGEKLNEITLDTTSGAKIPDSVFDDLTARFGSDENDYYGVQSFDTTADGSNIFVSFATFKNSTFLSSKDMAIYIYRKEYIKIALKDGTETKGYLTIPYDKKINEVTLEEINAVQGVQKSGFALTGITPSGIDSTFPKEGVRALNLVYNQNVTLVFKNETGSKVLATRERAQGTYYDTRNDAELQAAAKKEGYLLVGWRADLTSSTYFNAFNVPDAATYFYAVYENNAEDKVRITFKDGETVLLTAEIITGEAPALADYPELSEKVKKTGYTFKGWRSEGGTFIEAGSLRLLNAYRDTTYTAVYDEDDQTLYYMVTLYVDNYRVGRYLVKKGEDFVFADHAELLEAQKKDGYNFKGWQLTKGLKKELYTEKLPSQADDVELDAVFEAQSWLQKNLGGISTGGIIVIGVAVYFLLFRRRRRR